MSVQIWSSVSRLSKMLWWVLLLTLVRNLMQVVTRLSYRGSVPLLTKSCQTSGTKVGRYVLNSSSYFMYISRLSQTAACTSSTIEGRVSPSAAAAIAGQENSVACPAGQSLSGGDEQRAGSKGGG